MIEERTPIIDRLQAISRELVETQLALAEMERIHQSGRPPYVETEIEEGYVIKTSGRNTRLLCVGANAKFLADAINCCMSSIVMDAKKIAMLRQQALIDEARSLLGGGR
jgi:hypothetical protein